MVELPVGHLKLVEFLLRLEYFGILIFGSFSMCLMRNCGLLFLFELSTDETRARATLVDHQDLLFELLIVLLQLFDLGYEILIDWDVVLL